MTEKKLKTENILQALAALLIIYLIVLINGKAVDLPTADLGRHIMNGKIIFLSLVEHNWKTLDMVFHNNLYSYTQPGHSFVNHHWLSGVIYYLIERFTNMSFLTFFNILLIIVAHIFFFKSAQLLSNTNAALLITVISLPISSVRSEVRPESFSYLFLGLVFYLLLLYDNEKLRFKTLLISITVIQLLWINFHIFFFWGFFLCFCFGLKYLFQKDKQKIQNFLILGLTITIVSLLNPHGITGLLYPLKIFDGYGYMTVENQSIFFLQKRQPGSIGYYYFEFLAFLTLSLAFINRDRTKPLISIITLVFFLLAFKVSRAMSMAVFFGIPLSAYNLSYFKDFFQRHGTKVIIFILALQGFFLWFYSCKIKKRITSFIFQPSINMTARVIEDFNINGPIFNNFDIGGYLIYHLYPARRVFVDNRPEAYDEEFLEEVYLKVLGDETAWQALDKKINFNAIVFYRHDLTQHGQPFLIRRIEDPLWVPVFVDSSNIILVKDQPKNKELIEKMRLPQSIFKAVKNIT